MSISFSEFGQNSGYVADLFRLYQQNPAFVPEQWHSYFSSLTESGASPQPAQRLLPAPSETTASQNLQHRIFSFINAYRTFGHLKAKINPLTQGILHLPIPSDLTPEFHSISAEELDHTVFTGGCCGTNNAQVAELVRKLEQVYCGTIGYEYMHLTSTEERDWLKEKIELKKVRTTVLGKEEALRRVQALIEAEGLESEIHKKYVGAKRFSVEGGETVLPMLHTLIETDGLSEIIIGMAHRGRLNVLANVAGKPFVEIFREFEDKTPASVVGAGDVKYHMGWRGERTTSSGNSVKVQLAPNPSHLEFINPVVEGMVRALQDREYKKDRRAICPVLIHGDAAFIGQGVVPETLNLARTAGYKTAGTVHIVINNQVGFTTDAAEGRSSNYCTDIAKSFEAPIFHVNGEDVDAACGVIALAMEFRNLYERDVVIDLYCFRKYGHNEGDDPSYTQPLMYKEIKQKKSIPNQYAETLIQRGLLTEAEKDNILNSFKERFNAAREEASATKFEKIEKPFGKTLAEPKNTSVSEKTLVEVISSLTNYPDGFTPHPKLHQQLQKRIESVREGKGIDWGAAESLAYGSLVKEGVTIRITGQDAGRGTFSHRHLELTDYEKPNTFYPLATLDGGGSFEVYNSTLSESAVMGFEFGYSAYAGPKSLTIWEAQFGDFANGAQVIIDQFLASAEVKWRQFSGITLLLPHGYEGQGPEHSSARLERFLQLCADNNMTVAYPTTAAQNFHLLRRQALSEVKRPLVIMSPKSLLRSPDASSAIKDFTNACFEKTIVTEFGKPKKGGALILCSGKVYYDIAKTEKLSATVARIEQLYPFPADEIKKLIKDTGAKKIIWAQEEHKNMGAFYFVEAKLRDLGLTVEYVGREESASPATGSPSYHAKELKKLLDSLTK